MSQDEKLKSIKKLVVQNLTFYDAPISEVKVQMYAAELSDLDLESIGRTFERFRREKGRRQMPMPADIRDVIKPDAQPLTLEDEAQLAVGKIVQGLKNFPRDMPVSARSFIGETGWEVVESNGGWWNLCMMSDEQLQYALPRWKKLAEAIRRRQAQGSTQAALPDGLDGDRAFRSVDELMANKPKGIS